MWALCLLYVLPVILANRYYNDDTQRVLYHNAGWILDGRPLTDLVIKCLCGFHSYVYDIFPLPLLISITIFSVVSVRWSEKIYNTTDIPVIVISSFLPITLPFFLSNLSYRFDCLGFVFSVVLLMIPFLIDEKPLWKKVLLNSLCILASMCFYQATVGLYIGLLIITLFIRFTRNEGMRDHVFSGVISVTISTLVYKLVISSLTVDKKGWRSHAGNIVNLTKVPSQIINYISDVMRTVSLYVRGAGIRQIFVYLAIILVSATVLFLEYKERSIKQGISVAVLYCILPVAVFIASVLPMAILAESRFQARYLPALISIMFVFATGIILIYRKWTKIAILLGTIVCLCQISFSYAYGNALREQKEYEEYVIATIASNLEATCYDKVDKIVVIGTFPYSPIVAEMSELMPIFSDMVSSGMDNDGLLLGAIINHYLHRELTFEDISVSDREYVKSQQPVMRSDIYGLYVSGDKAIVVFE